MGELLPQHQALIEASAIRADVAEARGFYTEKHKAGLKRLGCTDTQCSVPALVIPLFDPRGEPAGFQIRPDQPRFRQGRTVKYETPSGQGNVLDVHPFSRSHIADPAVPLFITEGVRKGDAAVSKGLCCISLLGVWNWRGSNGDAGRTALSSWEYVALNAGRRVYIVFDSDVMHKPDVYRSLVRLRPFLEGRGAEVWFVYLPAGDGGAKTGLDDYFAAGRSVDDLLALASHEAHGIAEDTEDEASPIYEYKETPRGLVLVERGHCGSVTRPLSTFTARINADLAKDDGEECSHEFEMEARVDGRLESFSVPSREFSNLGWVVERLGAKAAIYPGPTARDHTRFAIQQLSDPIQKTIFVHTGWRRWNGQWVFLHAGGAIGPDGSVPGIDIQLQKELSRYRLPDPPDQETIREAVRRSLRAWEIAPWSQTVPVMGGIYTAPLGEAISLDLIPWISGDSGQRKSTYTVLVMNHYGEFDEERDLPANFSSTGNATEYLLFCGKDVVVPINDYCPSTDRKTAAQQEQTAIRIIRSVGNAQGRNRMTADGRLRGEKPPRCLPIATAEMAPPGTQSSEARTLEIEWARDSVDLALLTRAQQEDRPYYRYAMAAYLQYLARRMDDLKDAVPSWVQRTARAFPAEHGRVQYNAAKLLAGIDQFLQFALEVRAIDQTRYEQLRGDAYDALKACAARTGRGQGDRHPITLFREALSVLFAQGRVYVAKRHDGEAPPNAARWGYQRHYDEQTGDYVARVRSSANKIGWIEPDETQISLMRGATYKEVVEFARQSNSTFPITKETLGDRFDEAGLLVSKDAGRKAKRVYAEGVTQTSECWVFQVNALFPPGDEDDSAGSSQQDPPVLHNSELYANDAVKKNGSGSRHETPSEDGRLHSLHGLHSSGDTTPLPTADLPRDPFEDTPTRGVATLALETPVKTVKTVKNGLRPLGITHECKGNGSSQLDCLAVKSEGLDVKNARCVEAPSALREVLERVATCPEVALDIETTPPDTVRGKDVKRLALDPRRGRVRLLSLASARGTFLIDCFHVDPQPLFPLLADKLVTGHNLLFDLSFLWQLGFRPGRVRDTFLRSQLLSAAGLPSPKGHNSLGACVKRLLGLDLSKEQQKSDWRGRLSAAQLEYAARDAQVLFPLDARLSEEIQQAGLVRVDDIESRCLPALVWLANSGIPFHAEAWKGLAAEATAEANRLREELNATAPKPPGLDLGQGWNWNAPDMVHRVFRDVGIDLPDTKDETLALHNHPLADLLRRYRAASKLASSYGLNWLEFERNGRLYADWQQIGARAGRMSCEDPAAQTFPRDERYRACIGAPPARVLVKADYSQIELRIAAKIAGDRRMLEAYRAGEDLHTVTARLLTGKSEVTKQDRQLAKAVNFGLLYGMGAGTLQVYARTSYGVTLSDAEALEYRNAFFRSYVGLRRWHNQQPDDAIDARTLAGRRRLNVVRFTEKLNTPVQGTGADGLKRALALLWERRAECPGAFPVLACHDELVVECDADQAEAAALWLEAAMIDGMADLIDPVPVVVEKQIGPTWAG